MKRKTIHVTRPVWLALVFTTSAAYAQTGGDAPAAGPGWAQETSSGLNRFGLAYRFGLNISASFKNLGLAPAMAPGAAAGGLPHIYDNGWVLLDSSGNAGGETWNWGYQNASQVYGDKILMSASTPGDLARGGGGDPQHGFELSYGRELGHAGRCPFGLELAFGFTDLSFRNQASVAGGPLTVDSYAVPPDAFPPPGAPHAGSYDGPGPTLFDTPARLPVTVASQLDGSLYGFRLGPFLEIPLGERAAFTLSGGFALAAVSTGFSFQQSFTAPTGGAVTSMKTGSHSDLLPGGYVAGNLSWQVGRSVNLVLGAQYQNMGTYAHRLGDKEAEIDFSAAVFVTAGVGVTF